MPYYFGKVWKISKPIVQVALIFIIGHFVVKYAVKLINRGLSKSKMDDSLRRILCKTINILLHILLVLSALNTVGISTSGIVTGISAMAVAVTVALKDSLSNVAGGIILLFVPRFSTGDYIQVENNEGTVINIDLIHTTIRSFDNRQISIPNGVLINQHIINLTKEKYRRVDIVFPVSYNADIEQAKTTALNAINKNKLVLQEPAPPFVRVKGYADSSIELAVKVWCNTEDYWDLYYDLTEEIRKEFDNNNIEIPYNQLDVHII